MQTFHTLNQALEQKQKDDKIIGVQCKGSKERTYFEYCLFKSMDESITFCTHNINSFEVIGSGPQKIYIDLDYSQDIMSLQDWKKQVFFVTRVLQKIVKSDIDIYISVDETNKKQSAHLICPYRHTPTKNSNYRIAEVLKEKMILKYSSLVDLKVYNTNQMLRAPNSTKINQNRFKYWCYTQKFKCEKKVLCDNISVNLTQPCKNLSGETYLTQIPKTPLALTFRNFIGHVDFKKSHLLLLDPDKKRTISSDKNFY